MTARFVAVMLLIAVYLVGTVGFSVRSVDSIVSHVNQCCCSADERQAGRCCCTQPGDIAGETGDKEACDSTASACCATKPVPGSSTCCAKPETPQPDDATRQRESDAPLRLTSRCGCGQEHDGFSVICDDPRVVTASCRYSRTTMSARVVFGNDDDSTVVDRPEIPPPREQNC